jgi:hypothetical protein
VAKASASGYLEYKFGWENIYRSIKQLADVWGEVRSHQEYLETSIGKYVSLAARQSETMTPSLTSTYCPATTGVKITPELCGVKRTYCFSLDLKRTEADAAWSQFAQVMARLGTNDVLEALWDCVPYSFVVDWFTHANRLTKRRRVDYLSRDIRRMGYSTKTEWFGRLKYELTSPGYGVATKTAIKYGEEQCVQRTYARTPGFPPGTATVGLFGNLNKTQIAEGVALIIQRI